MQSLIVKAGRFFFTYRNSLFPAIFLSLFILIHPSIQFNRIIVDVALSEIGFTIALLGTLLRLFVIGYAYIVRGGKDKKIYAEDLVVKGFYSHCRNPMYLGNLMIAIGLATMVGTSVVYLGVIPFFIFVYYSIVKAEESFLLEKFGEKYKSYCQNVPRFLMNFKGLPSSLSEFRYDWHKALRKEYGTTTATLAGALSIVIWKDWIIEGYRSYSHLVSHALLFLPLIVFYLSIRYLKHNGGLDDLY